MVEHIPQFDFYLRFAKPLVLNLPEPNDRVLAAAWIQKLRDENVGEERLRTDYLKLLLFVLQRRRLAGPFAENPNQYDKLEEFPSSYRLQDVARSMIEADEAERREKIRKGLAGPSGDYPPYTIEYSADLLEYAAAQDIPNFGVQAYYAMSKEPIPKWDKAEKGIFPKSLISAMEKRDGDETLGGPVSSATLAPRRSRSRDPSKNKSQSRMQKTETKQRFRSKSEEPRQPPKSSEPITVKPPPDDRKPPTWGSNLIDVTEPPIKEDIYETIHKFDTIPYKELLGSPPQSAQSIPSGPMPPPCRTPPRRTPPPVTQIYSPHLPVDIAPSVYHEEQPSLLDVTGQSELDFREFDKMLAEFEQQQAKQEDICICTPPRPDLRPLPQLPSSPSLHYELPPLPQMPRMPEQESPSITKITETVSTVVSPSKTKTTKKTVTVKETGTAPSRSTSRLPVSKSTSTSKIPCRSTSSIKVSKTSSTKLKETGVGGDVVLDETNRLKAAISKDLKNLERRMAEIEAEHAAFILPPKRAPLPPCRSPSPPPQPFSPLQGEAPPLYESPPPIQSPMTPPPRSVSPAAYGTPPSPYRLTMTPPPPPLRRPMTPPSVYREPMTPPLPPAAPHRMPTPPSRVPCSPCSDDEFLEYERMFKGDTPPRDYSPQSYVIGKTAGEEAARRQYASLLPQASRERPMRRPIRRQTPSPERRHEEGSDEEFERYERLFQAGQQTMERQAPFQPSVAPQPSMGAYEIAQQQYQELVSLAPPSSRSRDIMETARRRIEELQRDLQPHIGDDMDRTPPPFSAYPEIREAGAPIIYRPEDFGLTGQERWQHGPQFFEGRQGFSPYQEPRDAMRKIFPQMDVSADALTSEYEPELAVEELDETAQSSASRRELEQSIREVVTEFTQLQEVTPAMADVPVTTPRRSPSPRRSTPFDAQIYSPLQRETPPELPDMEGICECIDNYGLPIPVSQAPPQIPLEQRVYLSPRRAPTPPQRPLTPSRPSTPPQRARTPPQRPPTPPQRPPSPTQRSPTPTQRVPTPPQRIATPPTATPPVASSQIVAPWSFQTPPSPQPTQRSPQFVAPPGGPMIDYEMPPMDITQFSPPICYSPPTSPTRPPSPFADQRTPPPAVMPKSPSSLRKLHAGLPSVADVCTGPCSPSTDRIADVTPPFSEEPLLSPSPKRSRTPPCTKASSPKLPSPCPSQTTKTPPPSSPARPRTPPRPTPAPPRTPPQLSARQKGHIEAVVAPERQDLIERVSRLVADVEDVQPPQPFEAPPRSPPPCLASVPSDQRHMMMETPPRDILHDVELQLSPEDLAPPMQTTTTTTTIEEEIFEELPSQFDFQGGYRPESPTVNLPFQAMRTPTVFDRPCMDDGVGVEIPPDEFGEFDMIPDSPQYSPGPNLEQFKKEIIGKAPTRRLRKVIHSKEVLAHRLPATIAEEGIPRGQPRRLDLGQSEGRRSGLPMRIGQTGVGERRSGLPRRIGQTGVGERRSGLPRRTDQTGVGERRSGLPGRIDQTGVGERRRGRPKRIDFDQPLSEVCHPCTSPQRPSYLGEPVFSPLTPTSRTPESMPQRRPRRLDFGEPDEVAPPRSRREWFSEEPLPPSRTPRRAGMQRVPRRIDFDQGEEGPCGAPCAAPPPPRAEWFGDYPLPSEEDFGTPVTHSPSRQARRMLLSPRLVVKKGEPCPRKMTARRRIDFDRPAEGAYVTPPPPERPEWTGEFPPLPGRVPSPGLPPQPLPEDLYGVAAPVDFHYVPSEFDTSLPPGLPSPPLKPPAVVPGWQTPPHLKMPSPKRPPPFQFRMPREFRDIISTEERPEELADVITSTSAPLPDDYFPMATELPHFTREEIEALPGEEVQRRSSTPPPCIPCTPTPYGVPTPRGPSPPQLAVSTSVQTPPPCQPCGSRFSDDEFLEYERQFGVPTPQRVSPPRPVVPTSAHERARQQYEQLPEYVEETTSQTVIKKTPTSVKKTVKTKTTKKTPPRTPPRRTATPPRTPPRRTTTSPRRLQETPRRRPPCATPPSRGGVPQTWMDSGLDLRGEDLPPEMGEVLPPRDMSPTANEFVERVGRHLYTPHKFDPFKAYMKKQFMVGKTKSKLMRIPAESVRKRRRNLTTIEETHREEFEDTTVPPHELFGLPEAMGFDQERFNRMMQYGNEVPEYVPMATMEERLNMGQMPLDQRMDIRVGDVPQPQISPRRPLIERAPMEFTVPEEHELPCIPCTAPRDIFEGDIELPPSPRTPPRTPPPRTPPPRTPPPRTPSPRTPSPRTPAPCVCIPGSPRTPVGMESPPFVRTPSPLPPPSPQRYPETPSPSSFRRRVQEHMYVEPPNPPCQVHLSPMVSPVIEDDYYLQQTPPARAVPETQFVQLTPSTAEEQLQQQIYDMQAAADAQYGMLMDSPQDSIPAEYDDDFVYPEQVNIMDRRHPEQFDLGPAMADPGLGWESPPIVPSRRTPPLPRVEFADEVTAISPPPFYEAPEEEHVEIIEEEETIDYDPDYLDDLDQVPELQYNDVLSARSPYEDDFDNLEFMSPPPAIESPPPCQPCSSPIDSPNFMRRIQQHEFTEGFLEGARPAGRPTVTKSTRMMGRLGYETHELDEITEKDETPMYVRTPPNLHPMLYANEPPSSGRGIVYESPDLPCPRRFISPRTRLQPHIPGTPKRTESRDRSTMKRRRIAFDELPPETSPSPRLGPTPPGSPQPSTSAVRTPPCMEGAPCSRSPRTPPPQERAQTVIETFTEEEEEEEFIEGGRPPWAVPSQFPYEVPAPFGGRTSPCIDAMNTSFMEDEEQDFRWIG